MITASQARNKMVSLGEVVIDQYLPIIESLINQECGFGSTSAEFPVDKLRQVEINRVISELKVRGFEVTEHRRSTGPLSWHDYLLISWA